MCMGGCDKITFVDEFKYILARLSLQDIKTTNVDLFKALLG